MNKQAHFPRQHAGAVLVVGLVLLLILTVIGLASIRGSDLQERMAGNTRDRNIAFQSAEAGLRAAEADLMNGLPNFNDAAGYWRDLNNPGAPVARPVNWLEADWVANSIVLNDDTVEGVTEQPRYIIEEIVVSGIEVAGLLGNAVDPESMQKMEDLKFYRSTSRGVGLTEGAEVVVQSTFAR